MSSKNKKSDDKYDKAEQQALKEAEIVAELGPNEKTRKEAEKLIETVENASTSVQEQEQEAIETVLDETKRAIKKTVSEAKVILSELLFEYYIQHIIIYIRLQHLHIVCDHR
jgi:hypothetical protein